MDTTNVETKSNVDSEIKSGIKEITDFLGKQNYTITIQLNNGLYYNSDDYFFQFFDDIIYVRPGWGGEYADDDGCEIEISDIKWLKYKLEKSDIKKGVDCYKKISNCYGTEKHLTNKEIKEMKIKFGNRGPNYSAKYPNYKLSDLISTT